MPRVVLKENEVLDDALRRFKRQVSRNGTLAEARKREFYVKPGVRRKLKSRSASFFFRSWMKSENQYSRRKRFVILGQLFYYRRNKLTVIQSFWNKGKRVEKEP